MQLGIFAKTFEGKTPAAVLAAVRRSGYEAVQYNMACSGLSSLPAEIDHETAKAVRSASEATGVSIAAVSATYNMVHPDAEERERGRRSFQAIAAAAHTMGTRLLTLCTGSCDPHDQWKAHPDNDTGEAWDEMCKEFQLLLPIAEMEDILLGVEPELANIISSAQLARRLLDTFGDGRIKIVFDPANLFDVATHERQKELIDEAIALLGDSIALAHAKDRLADGRFATAGLGVLDYSHYLMALRRSGFDGALITHGLASSEADTVALFLKDKIASLERLT
jgi:sugar phosphate isomerase/epimerase